MAINKYCPFVISDSDEDFIRSSKFKEPAFLENFENSKRETTSLILNNSLSKKLTADDDLLNNLNSALEEKVIAIASENSSKYNDKSYIGLLILRNLSPLVYFEHLWELFEPFGELESAAVFTKTNKVGVVKFKNVDDATKAFEILQGVMFFNQPLNIKTGLGDSRVVDKQKAKSRKEKYTKINIDENISSRFLLATNVFDKSMFHENSSLARRLYVDFLNIITYSKASIYHLFIDEFSDEGAIYMACSTLDEAKLIFKALNGCLYESRKVIVDCIPSQLYIHLFPISSIVSAPLKTDAK